MPGAASFIPIGAHEGKIQGVRGASAQRIKQLFFDFILRNNPEIHDLNAFSS